MAWVKGKIIATRVEKDVMARTSGELEAMKEAARVFFERTGFIVGGIVLEEQKAAETNSVSTVSRGHEERETVV
jgi:hypothetical protein